MAFAVAGFSLSRTACAWEYTEHHDITCLAVRGVCSSLNTERKRLDEALNQNDAATDCHDRETLARIDLLQSFICNGSCGTEPRPKPPVLTNCGYDYGDVVALVDYKNDPLRLDDYNCEEIPEFKRQFWNEAWESLTADEHFAPQNVTGVKNAADVALARFSYARQLLARQAELACATTERPSAATLQSDRCICHPPSSTAPVTSATQTMSGHEAFDSSQGDTPQDQIRKALYSAARALHLLEDAYAAGHNATRLANDIDPRTTTNLHNRYNREGLVLRARNNATDSWIAFGDGYLADFRNHTNSEKLVDATTRMMCSFVASYLNLDQPLPDCATFQGDIAGLLPILDDPSRVHRLISASQIQLDYAYTSFIYENVYNADMARSTRFHTLGATVEVPLASVLNFRLGADYDWYASRAVRRAQYIANDYERSRTRFFGMHTGLSLHQQGAIFRALSTGVTLDVLYGYTNVASNQSVWLRAIDGINLRPYFEALMYVTSLRVGLDFGLRRSALETNRFDFNLGPTLSISFRPL